jgi:2-phospho-L-lactate guanylyltransferase
MMKRGCRVDEAMMQPDRRYLRAGGPVGVVPLNRLDRAKSRLAGALAPAERRALVLALAERTLRALREADILDQIALVSPDDAALAWAEAHGAIPLRQPPTSARGGGLNVGLALARDWAVEQGATGLLIALGDLPLLTADEVRRFVAMTRLHPRVVALAPDRAGEGTNLLLARPASLAPLAYGRGSYARHRRLAQRHGAPTIVFHAPGAAFDVDTPADLAELIARGLWQPAQPANHAEPPCSATQREPL